MTNKTIEAIIGDTACSVSPVRLGACWAPAIRPEAPQHGIISKTRHFYLAETRHLNLGLTSIRVITLFMSNCQAI